MPVNLFVFMGLIASGKSTVAEAFAGQHAFPYFNTDVERKLLAGKAPRSRQGSALNQGIYTPEFSRRTYDALLDHATRELGRETSVVLDGSYHKQAERQRLADCASTCQASLYFILCQCPEEETRRRLAMRAQDSLAVSDGTWDIYLRQKESFEFPHEVAQESLIILDTTPSLDHLLRNLTERLSEVLPG